MRLTRLTENLSQVASMMPVPTLVEGEADPELQVDEVSVGILWINTNWILGGTMKIKSPYTTENQKFLLYFISNLYLNHLC